jgi:hypothetical protein
MGCTYFKLSLHTLTVLLAILALNILVPLQGGHEFCPNNINLTTTSKAVLRKRKGRHTLFLRI